MQRWFKHYCTRTVSEYGLWDDMPGAPGLNNEAGLLWIVTNRRAEEQRCIYNSWFDEGVSTNVYPYLRTRVAVNDNARFKVEVFDNPPGTEFCEHRVWWFTTPATHDDSSFREYQYRLPPNTSICAVRITIDDDPNNVRARRATALIDYIRIWNGNTIGWRESFSGE
jgi:hypothetical protein